MAMAAAFPSDPSTHERPRRKRCRITFSCTNCRRGKQRCDRNKPCRTCVIRGKSETCQYEEAVVEPGDSVAISESEPPGETMRQNINLASSGQSLTQFGYSNLYGNNALSIIKNLEQFEISPQPAEPVQQDSPAILPQRHREQYKALVQKLPCRDCAQASAAAYFTEFNWLYSLLDESIFDDQFREFYSQPVDARFQIQNKLDHESLRFPVLLFHVVAVALLFMPQEYPRCLDEHDCIDASRSDGGKYFNDVGASLWSLFEKNATSLLTVQASFLKVCWLKHSGRIVESWHSLAQVGLDAQDIGLHQERGRIEAVDAQSACLQAWSIVIQRRLMINLFIWETQMALTLGKSINLALEDFNLFPPTDTAISKDRTSTIPSPRGKFDKPNSFTARLLEYQLHSNLPRIIAFGAEGPFPKSFAKVDKLHQEALDFIENLPPVFRFENPDTSYDTELPYLPAQREYLCTVTWLFVVLLHRTYLFSNSRSRTEIIKASVNLLSSVQRAIDFLRRNQRRFFALSFFSVEASVSTLAILIAYPHENTALSPQALRLVKENYDQLTAIRDLNGFAGPGADVIRPLLARADKVHLAAPSDSNRLFDSHHAMQETTYDSSHSNSIVPGTFSNEDLTNSRPENLRVPSSEPSDWPTDSIDNIDYGCLAVPLYPSADMLYNDVSPAVGQHQTVHGAIDEPPLDGLGGAGSDQIPPQFTGSFESHSFWNFVNEGL